jgi:hypothetical protein
MSNKQKTEVKTKGVSSDEISFLIQTLDEIFHNFQISNTHSYIEKLNIKVLNKINNIREKIKQMEIEKPIGITQNQINQLYSTSQRCYNELPETFTDKEYNMKKLMGNRDERFFNKLYELYEASQQSKPSNSEVNNGDEMMNNNPGTNNNMTETQSTYPTIPRAELDTVTFTFTQEANCVDGTSHDLEVLTVEAKSSMGIDRDEGAFYVLKTEQWSIDVAGEINDIIKKCERAIDVIVNK